MDRKRVIGAAGLLAAGTIAGGVVAGSLSASAADNGSSSSTAAPAAADPNAATAPGPRGAAPVRSDEKALTGSQLTAAKAAALAAEPGGTVIRAETDAGDAAYEVHMRKADGTPVTVKLDKNLKLVKVEDGMGLGDPRPAGAPAGAPAGGLAGSGAESSSSA
ncbi:MAG: hypothetical protein QOE84_2654 [Actinomycetota bacterium]|nr:hypothetical protein [Actinomycetota bacterium]